MTPQERLKEIERVLSDALPGLNLMEEDYLTDAIQEALRLAREGGDGWQPIETAPQDGRGILGYDPIADACIPIFRCQADDVWKICWTGEPNPDCIAWQYMPEPLQ